MNLMSRLSSDARHRRRMRAARAEIRRAERAIEKRQRAAQPGYDELSDPFFLGVMALAVVVLVFDLGADSSVLGDWLQTLSRISLFTSEVPRV